MKRPNRRERRAQRREQLTEILRKLYGYQYIPHYAGSPHEGEELDDAELVLHELAHQTLMPEEFIFAPGNMRHAVEEVGNYIETLPGWMQDLNEIKTVAIEIIASRRLGLGINPFNLVENAAKNTSKYRDRESFGSFVLAVDRAKRTFGVQFRADSIVEMVNNYEAFLEPKSDPADTNP